MNTNNNNKDQERTNIGRNIRTIRESLKMTQEELAEKAGYKNSAIIVAIENGNNEPAYEKVKDIANALGVSIYQVKGQSKFRKVTGDGIYYSEADLAALDLLSPLIYEMDGEELDRILDYAILVLHASGKKPHWKKTQYQIDREEDS